MRPFTLALLVLPSLLSRAGAAPAGPVSPPAASGFVTKATSEWVAFPYSLDIQPGSVFDFSGLNHAPAGVHGRILVTPEGHFAFANRPAERVRFWGVNLCFSANFLERENADRLALTLRRAGYNTVRLHHFDRELVVKGGPSYRLDPEKLEKIDYLFSRLKEAGLYISIDLYCSRRFSQEEIPDLGREFGPEIKRLLPLSDRAFDSWKQFARNLLTHVNPHTGLSWAEDPALIGICPVNEDSTVSLPKDPVLLKLYEEARDAWVAEDSSRAGPDKQAETSRFLSHIFARNDERMFAFLREELKVAVPLTGSNYRTAQSLSALRARYDYVDNHQYWDHPEFKGPNWTMPYQFIQQSAVRRSARAPGAMMPTRIFGKPFTVTEYNYVWPNQYRAEGAGLMPAYASLQDWDAIYNFDYAAADVKAVDVGRSTTFGISSDPLNLLADRFAAVTFLRRDIRPAANSIGFVVRDESVYAAGQTKEREYPMDYTLVGLTTRIGTYVGLPENHPARPAFVVTDAPRSEDERAPGLPIVPVEKMGAELARRGIASGADSGPRRYLSDTGEIELRPEPGSFKLVAPRVEGFVLPARESLSGSFVSVENGPGFGAVYLLSADGADLSASRRVLLLHLTDAINTGARFTDDRQLTLTDFGALPHLVRDGHADISLRLDRSGAGVWRLWKVAPNGQRLAQVALDWKTPEQARARLDTVTAEGVCLAYELVKE